MMNNQRGSVVSILFGSIAVAGILSGVTMNLITGPLRAASTITSRNMAENEILMGVNIIIADAISQGDSDEDGFIEPREFDLTVSPKPTGGGGIPMTIGAARNDPWGTPYGYCVWDNGAVTNGKNDSGVGTDDRLNGQDDVTTPTITLISAGPDRAFETGCFSFGDGGNDGLIKVSGSDDISVSYTYAQASSALAGLWSIKISDTETAQIEMNLEVKNNSDTITARIDRDTGLGDFMAVKTDYLTAKTLNDPLTFTSDVYLQGDVGIGVETPSVALEVDGNIIADAPTIATHVMTKGHFDTNHGALHGVDSTCAENQILVTKSGKWECYTSLLLLGL